MWVSLKIVAQLLGCDTPGGTITVEDGETVVALPRIIKYTYTYDFIPYFKVKFIVYNT